MVSRHAGPIGRWEIHDNGGRPWQVKSSPSSSQPGNYRVEIVSTDVPSESRTFDGVVSVWPGIERKRQEWTGNTVLLDLGDVMRNGTRHWLKVEREIEIFRPIFSDEQIRSYVSPIGNNDVPYPVIVTDRHLYFPTEHEFVDLASVPPDVLDDPYAKAIDWEYQTFHRRTPSGRKTGKPLPKYELVAKSNAEGKRWERFQQERKNERRSGKKK